MGEENSFAPRESLINGGYPNQNSPELARNYVMLFEFHDRQMDGNMKTILLVDDDRDILSYLEDSLRTLGYNVIPKPDALSALSVIREGAKVDLVVSDYSMPGMDGHEFFTVLRRALPLVPVIILTGYGSVETYLKSLSLGVCEFVCKPIEAKELDRIVRAALERATT